MSTYLVWTDYETSGLDPQKDEIIEIGIIVTDEKLNELGRFQGVFVPSWDGFKRILSNSFVLDMHRKNGLWDEIISRIHEKGLQALWEFEGNLVAFLDHLREADPDEKTTFHIAGSGVAAFDLPFTKKHMPVLAGFLHYAPIDVGPSRRLWQWATGTELTEDNEAKNHRAIDDVKGHLREAREIRARFQSAFNLLPEESVTVEGGIPTIDVELPEPDGIGVPSAPETEIEDTGANPGARALIARKAQHRERLAGTVAGNRSW